MKGKVSRMAGAGSRRRNRPNKANVWGEMIDKALAEKRLCLPWPAARRGLGADGAKQSQFGLAGWVRTPNKADVRDFGCETAWSVKKQSQSGHDCRRRENRFQTTRRRIDVAGQILYYSVRHKRDNSSGGDW